MPPEDDVVAALTTSGSMVGSTTPPAKAVVAATDKAAARAIFFMSISSFLHTAKFAEATAHTQEYSSYLLSILPTRENATFCQKPTLKRVAVSSI